MNCIIIHGRLVRDPDIKMFNDNKALCRLTVAVDRSYKDKDGNRPTDFFNCVAFNKTAEMLEKYFNKGDGISIQGEMQNTPYTDKNGNKRDGWQVAIEKWDFELTKKGQAAAGVTEDKDFTEIGADGGDEDLPF